MNEHDKELQVVVPEKLNNDELSELQKDHITKYESREN